MLDEKAVAVVTVDIARETDRTVLSKFVKTDEGLKLLLQMEIGQFCGVRIIKSAPPIFAPPHGTQRRDPAKHMAQLRKLTGQDWRGRRG